MSPEKTQSFVYLLRPVRPGFGDGITPREEAVIDEHFARLKELLAEGRLVLAGPCLDAAFGIVIIETAAPPFYAGKWAGAPAPAVGGDERIPAA